jgi:hypothetical protein
MEKPEQTRREREFFDLKKGRNVSAVAITEDEALAGDVQDGKHFDVEPFQIYIAAEMVGKSLNEGLPDAVLRGLWPEINVSGDKKKDKKKSQWQKQKPLSRKTTSSGHNMSLAKKRALALRKSRKLAGANFLRDGPAALDNANQDDDQREDQQDMDKAAQRVRCHQTQKPENQKNNANSPEQVHDSLLET